MMRPNVFNLLVRRIVSNWRTALVAMLYSHFLAFVPDFFLSCSYVIRLFSSFALCLSWWMPFLLRNLTLVFNNHD